MAYNVTEIFWDIKEGIGNAYEWAEELVTGKTRKENKKKMKDSNTKLTDALFGTAKDRDTSMDETQEQKDKNAQLKQVQMAEKKDNEARDTIGGNLQDAGKWIVDKAKEVGWEVKEAVGEGIDKAKEVWGKVKDKLKETWEVVKDKIVEGKGIVKDYFIKKFWGEDKARDYLDWLDDTEVKLIEEFMKKTFTKEQATTLIDWAAAENTDLPIKWEENAPTQEEFDAEQLEWDKISWDIENVADGLRQEAWLEWHTDEQIIDIVEQDDWFDPESEATNLGDSLSKLYRLLMIKKVLEINGGDLEKTRADLEWENLIIFEEVVKKRGMK